MIKFILIICIFLSPVLQSCTPAAVIATTTSAGAVVAESDRSVGEAIDDTGIKIKIIEKYVKSKSGIFIDVETSVRMGTVLLTGIVKNQEIRMEAVKLIWEIDGVKEVINEIEIGNKQNLTEYTKDLWITTQVKAKTLNELGLDVITYNFETINGKVYVMGVTKNIVQSEKIIKVIRTIRGVKEISNHIIVRE